MVVKGAKSTRLMKWIIDYALDRCVSNFYLRVADVRFYSALYSRSPRVRTHPDSEHAKLANTIKSNDFFRIYSLLAIQSSFYHYKSA